MPSSWHADDGAWVPEVGCAQLLLHHIDLDDKGYIDSKDPEVDSQAPAVFEEPEP